MKKLLLVALIFCAKISAAQVDDFKDLYSLNVLAGITDIGTIYKVEFEKPVSSKLSIKPTLYVDVSSKNLARLTNVGLDLKGHYHVTALGDAGNLYVAAGPTAFLSSENDLYKPTATQSPSKFFYGLAGEVEVEFNLSPEVKISIQSTQRYMFNSIYGNRWYDISAGLKFNLFNN